MELKVINSDKTYLGYQEIKTCSTCGHASFSKCMLSGFYKETERKFPTVCGRDYSGWTQKPQKIGLIKYIKHFFCGEG